MFLGFLLTTSPTVGFSYLDTAFARKIEIPPHAQTARENYSVLEVFQRGQGYDAAQKIDRTRLLPMQGMMGWLVGLLVVELEVTPHNLRLRNVPDIQNAYLPIVRDLVSKNPPITIVAQQG